MPNLYIKIFKNKSFYNIIIFQCFYQQFNLIFTHSIFHKKYIDKF
jgi:hypothetical protein